MSIMDTMSVRGILLLSIVKETIDKQQDLC